MSEANWAQLIAMTGAVAIPGFVSCFFGWLSWQKSKAAYEKSSDNSNDLQKLREAVDGRFTQLLSTTAGRAHIEGFLAGSIAEAAKSVAVTVSAKDHLDAIDAKTVATAQALLITAAEAARNVLDVAKDKADQLKDDEGSLHA
jgi:hypothetical protein